MLRGFAACAAIAALVSLVVLGGASGANTPGKDGYVDDYCAKTNPGYPIEVYWGNPPAWYCTDSTSNPGKSIPFDPAQACASAGLGSPDKAEYGVATYVMCGTSPSPAHAAYTLSGVVTRAACKGTGPCYLRDGSARTDRPPVDDQVLGGDSLLFTISASKTSYAFSK